jgi:hypothetical protein
MKVNEGLIILKYNFIAITTSQLTARVEPNPMYPSLPASSKRRVIGKIGKLRSCFLWGDKPDKSLNFPSRSRIRVQANLSHGPLRKKYI